ncbi:MAG: hypothetical protein WDW36_001549 [Sanguina aurantia]
MVAAVTGQQIREKNPTGVAKQLGMAKTEGIAAPLTADVEHTLAPLEPWWRAALTSPLSAPPHHPVKHSQGVTALSVMGTAAASNKQLARGWLMVYREWLGRVMALRLGCVKADTRAVQSR